MRPALPRWIVGLAAMGLVGPAEAQHRRPQPRAPHPPTVTLPPNPYGAAPAAASRGTPAAPAAPAVPAAHPAPAEAGTAAAPGSMASAGGIALFPEIPDNPFAFATSPDLPPPPDLPPGLQATAEGPAAVHATPPSAAHPSPAEASTADAGAAVAVLPSMAGRHYGTLSEPEIIEALRTVPFGRLSQVGNTSVNLHAHLAGPVDGGYKPSELRHVEHWRAEIASFRVAQLLGIERVPPAVFRRVSATELANAPAPGILFDANGSSRGAMIYWVPVLRHIDLESPDMVARWSAWLRVQGEIPEEERSRAEEISTMITFDYLIGNWDRWHGTNTLVDGQNHLVYRDNNGGFFEPFDAQRRAIVWAWLRRVQRFSRAVIDRVRTLEEPLLRAAMVADSEPNAPLLNNRQIASFMGRRDELLMYVDTLVAVYGDAAVYTFP